MSSDGAEDTLLLCWNAAVKLQMVSVAQPQPEEQIHAGEVTPDPLLFMHTPSCTTRCCNLS